MIQCLSIFPWENRIYSVEMPLALHLPLPSPLSTTLSAMTSLNTETNDSLPEPHDFVGKMVIERRKTKKPLMEKLRRDRINKSLNEMKVLVLESLNKDVSRYSKMEKADILEMTVKFLKERNRQEHAKKGAMSWTEYRAGYNHCAIEVMRNLSTAGPGSPNKLQGKFFSHFAPGFHGNTNVTSHPGATLILTNTAPAVPTSPVGIPASKIPTVVWVPLPSPPPSPSNKTLMCSRTTPVLPLSTEKKITGLHAPASGSLASPKYNTSPELVTPIMWRPW